MVISIIHFEGKIFFIYFTLYISINSRMHKLCKRIYMHLQAYLHVLTRRTRLPSIGLLCAHQFQWIIELIINIQFILDVFDIMKNKLMNKIPIRNKHIDLFHIKNCLSKDGVSQRCKILISDYQFHFTFSK